MQLKDFIKQIHQDIALLYFDDKGELICKEFTPKMFKYINNNLLNMEVMETKLEDDLLEIWLLDERRMKNC